MREILTSPSDSWLNGLDTLRASAILLAFASHYWGFVSRNATFGWFSHLGWAGVDLFFVLSGYLMWDINNHQSFFTTVFSYSGLGFFIQSAGRGDHCGGVRFRRLAALFLGGNTVHAVTADNLAQQLPPALCRPQQ
jgi:hypothetical protein